MNKVQQLKSLLEDMGYSSMMEVVDCCWYQDGVDVSWNGFNDKQDLANGEGDTYSGTVTEGFGEWEGYTVVNLDLQMGYWVTYLFNNEMKVSRQEMEDLYE
jgi:hypothetical protein